MPKAPSPRSGRRTPRQLFGVGVGGSFGGWFSFRFSLTGNGRTPGGRPGRAGRGGTRREADQFYALTRHTDFPPWRAARRTGECPGQTSPAVPDGPPPRPANTGWSVGANCAGAPQRRFFVSQGGGATVLGWRAGGRLAVAKRPWKLASYEVAGNGVRKTIASLAGRVHFLPHDDQPLRSWLISDRRLATQAQRLT
jgi:hypothetical protein